MHACDCILCLYVRTRKKLFLRKNWNWNMAPKAMMSRVKMKAATISTLIQDSQKAASRQGGRQARGAGDSVQGRAGGSEARKQQWQAGEAR